MAARPVSLDDLRRYAVARTLFKPTTLARAITKLGFVQADPIRQPARAQDLTLRHRAKAYRAGDLEHRYARHAIEEDYFVNHGFLPRATQRLMHPREARAAWPAARRAQADAVLGFIRQRGVVHPREVDLHFAHGKVRNWFGGSTNASTQLLDGMHYRGLIRIAGRASGVRLYAACDPHPACDDPSRNHDALVDVLVALYAPLPERSLGQLLSYLCGGVPQWRTQRGAALTRAKSRLAQATVDGIRWYWPEGENPRSKRYTVDDQLRLLAPFDPIVWDRHRFERLWDWAYRFEAYTPAPQRVRGYYALPMLWGDRVIGWGNVSVKDGQLMTSFGYVSGRAPREAAYRRELDAEVQRMREFLGVD